MVNDAEKMVAFFEGYYGKYEPLVKQAVLRYCQNWGPRICGAVIKRVVEVHESKYKTPPDVAVVRKSFLECVEGVEHEINSVALPPPEDAVDYREEIAELFRKLSTRFRSRRAQED